MRPIDADAIPEEFLGYEFDGKWNGCTIKDLIDEQPTIQIVATDTNVGDSSEMPNSSDCISRQQALDAVGKYASVWMEYTDAMSKDEIAQIALNNAKSTMIRILKELPTAQPEPQWIPVSERLPRDGSWNIFTDGKNISVERYKADAIDHFFPAGRWFELEDVIAWMPLPEPYTK